MVRATIVERRLHDMGNRRAAPIPGNGQPKNPRLIALESHPNAHRETLGARHSRAARAHLRESARNRVDSPLEIFV
jgi:hypothetical protein